MKLIHDAKQWETFKSRRWDTETSPDLCFVSEDSNGLPLSTYRTIGNKFPKSQHCPVSVTIRIAIPSVDNPEMPRWNLRKADWAAFIRYIEENVNRIPPKVHKTH